MSAWSIGFGHASEPSADVMVGRARNSSNAPPPPRVFSQREGKKQAQDLEIASVLLDFEMRESRAPAFCTKDNLLNSIAYVNQELEMLGLPCLKFENGKCMADMFFYINRLHDLLVLYHKTSAVKDDLETKNHKMSCESSHHQSTCARLRREQDQLERELAQEREKTRQANLKLKQLSNKLKAEREEVKRLTAVVQSRDVQQRHDNKKKEREIIGLKERLHQLLADKVPDRKVGMDLMNVLSSGEGRRGTWKTGKGKQEEEMYQLVITGYEEHHRELMLENAALRDCLMALQRELSALLKRSGNMAALQGRQLRDSSSPSVSIDETSEDPSLHSHRSITDFDEGYIQMPFDIVRKEIERAFKTTCDQISEGIKKSILQNINKGSPSTPKSVGSDPCDPCDGQKRSSGVNPSEMERLKKQVNNYKDIIQQQEELIQQSLHSHSQSVEATFLHESQLLREKENLSEQKKLFFEEKSSLEKERQALADAVIRLGKDRQALQEERSSLLKQHIQQLSPMKENQKPRSKGDGPTRLLPATPLLSPSSSRKGSRATTPVKLSTQHVQNSETVVSPKKNSNNDTPVANVQTLHTGATIHFTPRSAAATTATSLPTQQPLQRRQVPTLEPSAPADHAARLESIRASLLRIKKSASQQQT